MTLPQTNLPQTNLPLILSQIPYNPEATKIFLYKTLADLKRFHELEAAPVALSLTTQTHLNLLKTQIRNPEYLTLTGFLQTRKGKTFLYGYPCVIGPRDCWLFSPIVL